MTRMTDRLPLLATSMLVTGLLLPPSADAQQPKPTPSPAPAAGPAGAIKKPPTGPQADSYSYMDTAQERAIEGKIEEKEKIISEKRKSMMQSLTSILAKYEPGPKKAGVLFRLAELEWEEAQYAYFVARKKYEKEYEAFLEGSVKVQPVEPKPDYSSALNYYKQILREYPDYERIDQVMYYLGYGLIRAGNEKEGASYFSRLIKGYPSSKYLPDSYLAVAEYYFKNDLLFAARTNYNEVLKYKDSPVYNYALYKLGWVYFNLKEWRPAIDTFKSVIEGIGTGEQKKIEFRNQAMNDLVMVFAEVPDGWLETRDYFTKIGGDQLAWDKLQKLVEKYVTDDKNEEAITVYRYFLSKKVNDGLALEWYKGIADAVRRMNDKPRLEKTQREIVDFFDAKATWAVVNKNNTEIYEKAQVYAEDTLDFIATGYHQQAQKTNDRNAYIQAAKDYELFLDRFPKSAKAYKVRFFVAEIYFFELQEWEKAAVAYRSVVKADAKGEYAEDAAYGAVLALQQLMDPERAKSQKVVRGKGAKMKIEEAKLITDQEREIKPTPLNEYESRFVEACDSFRVELPKSDHTPEVMFYAAEVLRRHDMLAESIPRLETIVEHHAKHPYAAHAANSIFGAASLLKKWDLVEKWARYLIDKRNFTVKKKDELQKVIAIALSQQADDLQKANRFDDAAQKMVDLQNEFPKHELAPKALFNAAAIYERGKKTDRALELYMKLINTYPENEITPDAVNVVGFIHEARIEYDQAAEFLESMQKWPKHPSTPDALFTAASIRTAMGKHQQAIANLSLYMSLFKDRPDIPEVYMLIGDVHEKAKDWDRAIEQYKGFAKKFPQQGFLIAKANYLIGKAILSKNPEAETEADPWYTATINQYKRLSAKDKEGIARHWAAEARYMQGEAAFKKMKSIQLALPEWTFRKLIKDKAEWQVKAQNIYLDVFNFKSDRWSAAGATRIGDMYIEFSEALYRVPIPKELSLEEQELYKALIDEVAFPLQEKAISAFQTAVAMAQEKQVYSSWSASGAKSLARLNPEVYPLTGEVAVRGDHHADAVTDAGPALEGKAPMIIPPMVPFTPTMPGGAAPLSPASSGSTAPLTPAVPASAAGR